MGQGRESAKQYLKESSKLAAEVEKEIKEKSITAKVRATKKGRLNHGNYHRLKRPFSH